MELKDFVAETLQQIVEGVKNAKSAVELNGAAINPDLLGDYKEHAKHGLLYSGTGKVAQIVEFNVALSVKEGTGTKGGIESPRVLRRLPCLRRWSHEQIKSFFPGST